MTVVEENASVSPDEALDNAQQKAGGKQSYTAHFRVWRGDADGGTGRRRWI